MFDLIATTLAWFYDLWPSYGMAIVMLTFLIMLILTPLTLKQTRSMIKMQHIQPELKKIQNRHKGDRDRLNKEVMAFYQANEVNPMSSCLPIFVQMPVFLVLYQVIRGLTRRLSDLGQGVGWVAGRLANDGGVQGLTSEARPFFPDYIDHDSSMFQELSQETEMISFGFDLSRSASEALSDGIGQAIPYFLLILVVFVTSWYQQRQIRGRNPQAAINPQQQLLFKVMPFLLPVFSFGFDAALVVYFVASNVYRIAQQGYITRKFYGPGKEPPAVVSTPSVSEKSGGQKGGSSPTSHGKARRAGAHSSSEARRKRTTAGSNENSYQAERKTSTSRKSNEEQKKQGNDTTSRRRSRKSRGGEKDSTRNDGRPPGSSRTSGRTTQPGSNRNQSSKKKRKKKRK